jgi:hypothetical protein
MGFETKSAEPIVSLVIKDCFSVPFSIPFVGVQFMLWSCHLAVVPLSVDQSSLFAAGDFFEIEPSDIVEGDV